MVQLQYTSRIKLDEKLFNKIDRVLKLIERVDAELPADSPIRADQDYQRMLDHRRIDSFKVIEARPDPDLTNATDFSRFSVEAGSRPATTTPSARACPGLQSAHRRHPRQCPRPRQPPGGGSPVAGHP
jgi:hypothetical protein